MIVEEAESTSDKVTDENSSPAESPNEHRATPENGASEEHGNPNPGIDAIPESNQGPNVMKMCGMVAAGAMVVAPMAVALPVLGVLGFGAAGPVAGKYDNKPCKV